MSTDRLRSPLRDFAWQHKKEDEKSSCCGKATILQLQAHLAAKQAATEKEIEENTENRREKKPQSMLFASRIAHFDGLFPAAIRCCPTTCIPAWRRAASRAAGAASGADPAVTVEMT